MPYRPEVCFACERPSMSVARERRGYAATLEPGRAREVKLRTQISTELERDEVIIVQDRPRPASDAACAKRTPSVPRARSAIARLKTYASKWAARREARDLTGAQVEVVARLEASRRSPRRV